MFFLFIARKSIKGFLAVAALCAHRPWALARARTGKPMNRGFCVL